MLDTVFAELELFSVLVRPVYCLTTLDTAFASPGFSKVLARTYTVWLWAVYLSFGYS